jgi:hypothetical protein
MKDSLTPYEHGLDLLLEALGRDHPRYSEVLSYEQRLRENIIEVRRYGDDNESRRRRARIIYALNDLAADEVGVSFNQLSGLETSTDRLKGALNRFFIKADIPPDLPFYERVAALFVGSLGQVSEESVSVAAHLLGLLILSTLFASWLAYNDAQDEDNIKLFFGVVWLGLTVLPLIAGFLPQRREESLYRDYDLTIAQSAALKLDKMLGTYAPAYLVEIAVVILRLGLGYLGLWSALGTIGRGIFWFIAEWLAFTFSFVGSVIAVKYWENLLREERDVGLQVEHFLLGLGFPLIVYPAMMVFGVLTSDIWKRKEYGCIAIGLALLFLAFLAGRKTDREG